ncbi:MAG: metallophosphoesterase [Oscillospiraceae bacterium]|nr:metallophosphoesterase [Oscillospiraceae bacterium]
MIYVTGDIHIPSSDIQKLTTKRFPEQADMKEDDFLIICGDFGGIWDGSREEQYWIKWLNSKNFTTLFIDGNHENFDMLDTYDIEVFHGGRVHRISDKVYHLMRGEVITLDGKRIFALGGAESHDKPYRKEGKTWWRAEIPSADEYRRAQMRLQECGNCVDIIITHCAPTSIQNSIAGQCDTNELTDFLEMLMKSVSYNKWFFGHYHLDLEFDKKHVAVFDKIHPVRD